MAASVIAVPVPQRLADLVRQRNEVGRVADVQRAIARQKGEGEPMSEKLAARMTTLINAELLMILSIPLAATTMARGIGYVDFDCTIPGGLCVALALFGLGGKYVKEALDWEEDAPSAIE